MLELSECLKWHLAACVCEEAHSIVHICGKLYEDHAGSPQTHTHTSQIQRASQKDIHSLETNSGKKWPHWWNTLPANSALSSVLQRLTQSLQKHAQHVTFDHSCSHISLWKRTGVIKLHPLLVVAMVYENSNYSVSISKLHWPKTGKALDTKLCQLCQIKTYSYCYYFSYWLLLQFLVVPTGKFP